jgi:hypothetical protein
MHSVRQGVWSLGLYEWFRSLPTKCRRIIYSLERGVVIQMLGVYRSMGSFRWSKLCRHTCCRDVRYRHTSESLELWCSNQHEFLNFGQTICNSSIDFIHQSRYRFRLINHYEGSSNQLIKSRYGIAYLYLGAHNLLLNIIHHRLFLEGHTTAPTVLTIGASHGDLALLDSRLKRTASHVQLLSLAGGRDIEVKDVHRQTEGGAGVGDVHDACHVALNSGAGEEEVDLVVGVAEAAEVFDAACLSALS